MAVSTATLDRVVSLSDVSWETYEHLLADLRDKSAPRMTYDRGTLEIMSPTAEHEEINRAIASLVEIVCEELDLDCRNLGSTTFKRQDIVRGFEPDSCFYIASLSRIKGKLKIDLLTDPPPDLVIEVDVTHSSIDKLSIFSSVGVPEVWRYDGSSRIYTLESPRYVESTASKALPQVDRLLLDNLIEAHSSRSWPEWVRMVRKSVR